MTVQPTDQTPQSLWREQATRWLEFVHPTPTGGIDPVDEDQDPDPPPAAPAMRSWPRVFPQL